MYKKIAILGLLLSLLATSAFGCKTTSQQIKEGTKPVTLTYWRVFDGEDDFSSIIQAYQALHPYITIDYKKLRYEEYEKELLNALAEDRGPDIISIHNTWIKKYQSKLAPMPASTAMVVQVEQGAIKKEIVSELRTSASPTIKQIQDGFVDIVASDVIIDNQVYGLPLSVDTLAMYYNKDLLNSAGISEPAKYWNEDFQQQVKKLTKQDIQKGITQAGVAMGTGSNIERSTDLISVIMMQNGTQMMDGNDVTFNEVPDSIKSYGYNPGLDAVRFYSEFANPNKEVYSWNSSLPNSLEMFMNGNLAIMFGYAYHLPTIRAGAAKLNFSIAKLPQIEGSLSDVNFGNYWVESVLKKSTHTNEAWNFIIFATQAEQAKTYLQNTKKPAALRSLIDQQKTDGDIGVFVSQLLTAKSWYHGKNPSLAEEYMEQMLDSIAGNTEQISQIINDGAAKVQQTVE